MGKIGAAVARRARGFGMTILYRNRSARAATFDDGEPRRVDLETLLRTADVVTIHAPLTEETRHLVDGPALATMKPSAVLVNTARGPIVDEGALIEALRSGTIAAAGLDVFEREPAIEAGLADLPNVVLAPHIGSATTDARAAMVRLCCENIVAVVEGGPPLTAVTGPA
jgi:lactate dehydrogenase-like 2-hydroxyacid dehydrogenase